MATNILDYSEIIGKDVFTDRGAYCGKIKDIELDLPKFRIRSVVVDAARGSYLAEKVGGKKGVLIPYGMVNAIEDVVVIKHFSASVEEGEKKRSYYEKEKVEED